MARRRDSQCCLSLYSWLQRVRFPVPTRRCSPLSHPWFLVSVSMWRGASERQAEEPSESVGSTRRVASASAAAATALPPSTRTALQRAPYKQCASSWICYDRAVDSNAPPQWECTVMQRPCLTPSAAA